MKCLSLYLSLFFLSFLSVGQHVNWINFKQLDSLQKIEKRPFLVDFYTDWCGWCKHMDATTYADPQIVTYLNQHFYAVKFNAESKEPISYLGKTYINQAPNTGRSPHDLAKVLLNNSLSYPTTLFMSELYANGIIAPGYLKANEIAPFLVYYQEKLYGTSSIESFRKDFTNTFEQKSTSTQKVNWVSIEEAFKRNENATTKRKIFAYIANPTSIASIIMDSTTFLDQSVTAYLNQNYWPVKISAFESKDIKLSDQLFTGAKDGQFHQLVYAVNKDLKFPFAVIFNEDSQIITPVPEYMNTDFIQPVLHFFKEDAYKTMSFPDYSKNYKK